MELLREPQGRILMKELVGKVVVVFLGVEGVECFVIATAVVGIVEVAEFVAAVVGFVVGTVGSVVDSVVLAETS